MWIVIVSYLCPTSRPRMARIAQRTAPKFSQKTAEVAEDERWAFDAFSTIWSTLVAGNNLGLHRSGTTGSVLKTGATILSHIMSWFSGRTLLIRGNPLYIINSTKTQPHLIGYQMQSNQLQDFDNFALSHLIYGWLMHHSHMQHLQHIPVQHTHRNQPKSAYTHW